MWRRPAAAPLGLCVRLCSETMGALQCVHWPAAWSRCVIPSCWKASGLLGLWFHSAVWLCHQWCWDLISSCVGAVFSSAQCGDKNRRKECDGCFVFPEFSILCTAHTVRRDKKDGPSCMIPFFFNYLQAWIMAFACARLFVWVRTVSPAGGSTPLLFFVRALKATELSHMRRLQPVTVFTPPN